MTSPMRPGLGSAAAYQVSGTPFLTGAVIISGTQYLQITFPTVARSITVINKNANQIWPTSSYSGSTPLFVFFGITPTGSYPYPQVVNNNFTPISGSESSVTFDVRTSQVFVGKFNKDVNGAFNVIAELTSISPFELYYDGLREGVYSGTVGIDM